MSEPALRKALPFLTFGIIAAVTASAAATSAHVLGFLPWTMFIGWLAWFTRPTSARQGLATWSCVLCGTSLGALAVTALGILTPSLGIYALSLVVLIVTVGVVSMRAVRFFDNIPAWFLGLVAFFAAHMEPGLSSIAQLGASAAIGVAAGWLAQQLQRRALPKLSSAA